MQLQTPDSSDNAEIVLRPEEKLAVQRRTEWRKYYASVPLPALWVTARVDLSLCTIRNVALKCFRDDLRFFSSKDSIANAYLTFLQKVLTKLNRKVLKSRNSHNVFRFLGTLESNSNDSLAKDLHYHFFLWDPNGLFIRNPTSLESTADVLHDLWLNNVNDVLTQQYKPIDIQIVRNREDAARLARYMHKANSFSTSYELFDVWSTSRIFDGPTCNPQGRNQQINTH